MKSAIGQTLVQNGTLVDGTGDPVIPDAAVLIEDGKIAYAGETDGCPENDAKILDARGG